MVQEEELNAILLAYYSRREIQEAICNFAKHRETVPRYVDAFGKRPDTLEYPSDVLAHIQKGATSLHVSEELWSDPLSLKTGMSRDEQNELRTGWDLLIDIDSKYLDYSKISCKLIAEAFEHHNVKSYAIKFSGSKGFHMIVPWKAFPKEINGIQTKNMFPEWPRIIAAYLNDFINKHLVLRVSELTNGKMSKYIKGAEQVGDQAKEVMPDIVLVSPRHLFRAPYSLHEKTRLASIVIKKSDLDNFKPSMADPFGVKIDSFYPDAREGEARELLVQALDWGKSQEKPKAEVTNKEYKPGEYKLKIVSPDLYPPCIQNILKGMKDGKKRGLFILINFLRSVGKSQEEIIKQIEEWNKKNYPILSEGYIRSQLDWSFKQKPMLPQSCDKPHYKDIGVCDPDILCTKLKNPVTYPVRKFFKGKEFSGKKK